MVACHWVFVVSTPIYLNFQLWRAPYQNWRHIFLWKCTQIISRSYSIGLWKKMHSCTFSFGIQRLFCEFSLSLLQYFQYCRASILRFPLNKNIAEDYYATFSRDFHHQTATLECWHEFHCILALFTNILWLISSWFRHRLHFEMRDFRVVLGGISDLSDEPPYLSAMPW